MKFIVTNNLGDTLAKTPEYKPTLLNGLPEQCQFSHLCLPNEFHSSTTNLITFMANNKDVVKTYLDQTHTDGDLWTLRSFAFIDLLHVVGQFFIPFEKKNHELQMGSLAILKSISNTFFRKKTTSEKNIETCKEALRSLPGVQMNTKGFVMSASAIQTYVYIIGNYVRVHESIEKEMYNRYRDIKKVDTLNQACFIYNISDEININDKIKENVIITLLQLLERESFTNITVENHTATPLAGNLDMDFVLHFAAQGYQMDIDNDGELLLYSN